MKMVFIPTLREGDTYDKGVTFPCHSEARSDEEFGVDQFTPPQDLPLDYEPACGMPPPRQCYRIRSYV